MNSSNGKLGVAVASAIFFFFHLVGIKVGIFNTENGI